jgi:tRNA(Leu) C34 or U34 (ribose-2'-O)-methylase TrmL
MSSIGSPKKRIAAFLFQAQQAALDRADRRNRDIAVFGGELAGVVADELHHRPQVFQIEQ